MARLTLFLLAVLLTTIACRPTPSDSVEYLHREDAIIIQMLAVGEEASEIDRALAVPEFTLYGDGTLIYQKETADGTRLLQTLLPGNAVQTLLEAIVDVGFLDFTYDQPAPEGASSETTFFYAHTLDRANAVRLRGVSSALPEDADDEFDQYGKVQTFVEILRELDPAARGGTEPTAYIAADYVVTSLTVDGVSTQQEMTRAEVIELIAGLGRTSGSALEDLALPIQIDPGFGPAIRLAPLLPYYENFPEFDLQ